MGARVGALVGTCRRIIGGSIGRNRCMIVAGSISDLELM